MSTTHVQILNECFRECRNDYSLEMVPVVEKIARTKKCIILTVPNDFWQRMDRKAHMKTVKLRAENGYVHGF